MNFFHIRSHCFRKTEDIENWQKFADEIFDRCIFVWEYGDDECSRDHLHIHGTSNISTVLQFRKELLARFQFPKTGGNANYSLSGPDCKESSKKKRPNENGFVYVSKGPHKHKKQEPDVKFKKGFTDEEILAFHEEYWKNNPIYQATKDAITVDLKPVINSKKTWTQKITEELISIHVDKLWNYRDINDLRIISNYVLKRMGQLAKALDENIFKRICNAVLNGLPMTELDEEMWKARWFNIWYASP
jgi:hypothetical protein